MTEKRLDYHVLEEFDSLDLRAMLAMLMHDLQRKNMKGPMFRWERIFAQALGDDIPRGLENWGKLADEFDSIDLSDADKVWEKNHWPVQNEGCSGPELSAPCPQAWRELTWLDVYILYSFASKNVRPCMRGPRMVFLCRVLEEVCGGRGADWRQSIMDWAGRNDLTDADLALKRHNRIETIKHLLDAKDFYFEDPDPSRPDAEKIKKGYAAEIKQLEEELAQLQGVS